MAARFLKPLSLALFFLSIFSPVTVFAVVENDELSDAERISSHQLRQRMQESSSLLVFDARSKRDYDQLHIEGAVLPLPLSYYNDTQLFHEGLLPRAPDVDSSLAASMQRYPKDQPIVTYCNRDCKAAAKLLRLLNRHGYKNVQAMEEGVQAWKELGYPVVTASA